MHLSLSVFVGFNFEKSVNNSSVMDMNVSLAEFLVVFSGVLLLEAVVTC